MVEEQNQKHYEMLYIVPVQYTDDELPAIIKKIKDILTEHGCQLTYEEDLGKRRLAYPIKHIYHGYYWLTEFNMDSQSLKKLNNTLRLTSEVLRHLIIAKEEKTVEEIAAEKTRKEEELKSREEKLKAEISAEEKVEKKEEKKKELKKGKVSLEDLDKKLDELIDDSIL